MSEPLPETPVLPQGPINPDVPGIYHYAGNLNRMLHDQLSDIIRKANDNDLTDGGSIVGDIDITGNLIVTGTGDFTSITVDDEAYDATGWNGDLTVPTKNALRDYLFTLGTAAFKNTGTSGDAVPLLNAQNTWSATQYISQAAGGVGLSIRSTNAGNTGNYLEFVHDSISPQAGDFLSLIISDGRDSAGNLEVYTQQYSVIVDATSTLERGVIDFQTVYLGAFSDRLTIGGGVYHTAASGTDKGDNTLNFGTLYQNGNLVPGMASQATGDVIYRSASAWSRLAIGTARQALLVNAGVTAPEWVSIPFTRSYESAEQTITSGGALTLAHSLTVTPKLIQLLLINKTTEAGYAVGDVVFINPHHELKNTQDRGTSVIPDATNLNIRFGGNASVYEVLRKDTGGNVVLANGNWRLIVRAWA